MSTAHTVIAIDPGRSKCGLAVVTRDPRELEPGARVLHQVVIPTAELECCVRDLSARFTPDAILVGNGTNSAEVAHAVETAQDDVPVVIVDERLSTVDARKRYFQENPPRGLRRLIPVSLQVPSRPYDDYVALILAERYLAAL